MTAVLDLQPGDVVAHRGGWFTLAARPVPRPVGDRLNLHFVGGSQCTVHWLAAVPARTRGGAMDARPDRAVGHTAIDDAARMTGAQNPREERVDASRFVLRRARSRADLRLLLDALGLNTTTSKGD